MTIKSSGPISIADIAAELRISAVGLGLGDSRVRALLGHPTGAVYMSSAYGKSSSTVFNMVIGSWEPAQNDIERGFTLGQGGSISPAQFKGVTFRGLYATNYDNNVYLWFDSPTPAMTLTIAGAGTVNVPANSNSSPFSVPWNGLYAWFSGRNGQSVQVTLT